METLNCYHLLSVGLGKMFQKLENMCLKDVIIWLIYAYIFLKNIKIRQNIFQLV